MSMYRDPDRQTDFSDFIKETLLQVIKPPVVIMSGEFPRVYMSEKSG